MICLFFEAVPRKIPDYPTLPLHEVRPYSSDIPWESSFNCLHLASLAFSEGDSSSFISCIFLYAPRSGYLYISFISSGELISFFEALVSHLFSRSWLLPWSLAVSKGPDSLLGTPFSLRIQTPSLGCPWLQGPHSSKFNLLPRGPDYLLQARFLLEVLTPSLRWILVVSLRS